MTGHRGFLDLSSVVVVCLLTLGCDDRGRAGRDSGTASLPPVFPVGPSANTNWNADAGRLIVVAASGSEDSAAIVLPNATDSTMALDEETDPELTRFSADLFGRGGKIGSATVLPLRTEGARPECPAWPAAKVQPPLTGWRVGFERNLVIPIKLDSIEGMSSTDSAALAASLARSAATLPTAADPAFRGLPFRVRFAYTFRIDSIEGVIADVVRVLPEEANPRLDHLFVVAERRPGTTGQFTIGYYSRTAGPEESTQAIELLAAVAIGPSRRPAAVVNVEYDDGGKLGLLERSAPGQWRMRWRSAYTGC